MSDGGAADALFGAGGGEGGGGQAAGSGENGGAAVEGQGGGEAGVAGAAVVDPGAGAGQGGGAESWYGTLGLSDAAEGDKPSDLQWLQNKGYKDLPTTVKAMRALESRVGGAIVPPKEGDAPEKFDAFYKAIGRPEAADGYEIKVPDGAALDDKLVGSFRDTAFALGVPKAMADKLGEWYVSQQLDMNAAMVAQRNQETTEKLSEWGAQRDANLALANRAAAKLGISREDVAQIQQGYGAGKTLDLLMKLGGGMAEDAILGNPSGRQNFGISPQEAKIELAKFEANPDNRKALIAKDAAVTARWERLNAAIAAGMDEDDRRSAA